ncbi:MAG: molybdopterin-dependent oxidoreductase [Bacteroidota bacterium]|nr:molybdopterin-dependent oxidoreductase [Bacteroidota bacterium]
MANFLKSLLVSNQNLTINQVIVKKTIVSFFLFFLFIAAAIWSWKWLRKQPLDAGITGGIQQPIRDVLNKNENVFSGIFSNNHLVKEFPLSKAVKKVRVNGNLGMGDDFDPETWALYIIKKKGDTLTLNMEDIKKLPKTEIVFDFKCIEGWSQVTHWGGVKFSDFLKAYGLNEEAVMNYVGLNTPDEEYYVGIDMKSAMHPQTLLCYEMNGKPLPMNQGYPLRIIIPVKYGIKSIKRIGTMFFDNKRPPDYWFERGYDYYSGL